MQHESKLSATATVIQQLKGKVSYGPPNCRQKVLQLDVITTRLQVPLWVVVVVVVVLLFPIARNEVGLVVSCAGAYRIGTKTTTDRETIWKQT